jgi:hypothetical protein
MFDKGRWLSAPRTDLISTIFTFAKYFRLQYSIFNIQYSIFNTQYSISTLPRARLQANFTSVRAKPNSLQYSQLFNIPQISFIYVHHPTDFRLCTWSGFRYGRCNGRCLVFEDLLSACGLPGQLRRVEGSISYISYVSYVMLCYLH